MRGFGLLSAIFSVWIVLIALSVDAVPLASKTGSSLVISFDMCVTSDVDLYCPFYDIDTILTDSRSRISIQYLPGSFFF